MQLSSNGDFLISNSDGAMRKLSKENPDEMICHENRAECTNVIERMEYVN